MPGPRFWKSRSDRRRWPLLGVAATAGAALAAIARRRRRLPTLPDPQVLAAETATAVHNAAKGTVIAAVREADGEGTALVEQTVRQAISEAVGAGADVTSVAIGVVEGAAEVAHLLGIDAREAATLAARTVVEATGAVGEVARHRIEETLAPLLS